jgi:hypothetical protein
VSQSPRSTHGRLWAALLLTGLLAACSQCGGGKVVTVVPDAGQAAEALAVLEAVKGVVVLERGGQRGLADLGYLFANDALETGANSEAKVRFPGGRIVEVGSDARLLLTEGTSGLVLKVDRGLVLSRVPSELQAAPGEKIDERKYSLAIETPFGLTRIGTGQNELKVEVTPTEARVSVMVGSVEFVSRNGKAIIAGVGEVTATAGEAVFKAKEAAPDIVLSEIQATVYSATGRSEVKKKGATKWKNIDRKGEAFAAGDQLRVREGRSVVELKDSGSRFIFPKGTEILFDEGTRDKDGIEISRLTLQKGEMLVSLANGKKSRVVVSGFELISDLGGQFSLVKTGDGVEVNASTGDLRLSSGELVKAGQRAKLSTKEGVKPEIVDVGKRELGLVSRNNMKVFHPNIGSAVVNWDGPAGDYNVTVASDSRFESQVLSGVVHQPWVNVPIPVRGTLFWRVTNAAASEVARGSAFFAPEPSTGPLGITRNEVPEGTEKTTIYFQDKPPAVTFVYKAEEGAAKYRLLVYREGDLSKPVTEVTVKEIKVPLEAGTLTEGGYVWSVTPLSATGEELRGGRMNKLDIVYDNAIPSLVIKSPKNGQMVGAGPIEVAGIAPVGAKVFVNGKPAPLDEKARFSTSTTPIGRPPLVIFRMSQSSGPEVMTVRMLRRGR